MVPGKPHLSGSCCARQLEVLAGWGWRSRLVFLMVTKGLQVRI